MATDQSTTQAMIQSLLGAQTAGQSVSGERANNGNPGTIYNQPQVPGAPQQPGAGTSQFGAWVASPGTILAPGNPVDPYAAIRQTGLQAQPNGTLDDILNRIRSGNFGITPNPSAPGPGTGTPPGTQPPGTPGYQPPGGTATGRPIGPISGPTWNNPHDWQGNYNNAQPNTNLTESGLGRTAALDWLRLNQNFGGNTNGAWNGVIGRDVPAPNTPEGQSFWGGMWEGLRSMASNAIREGVGNLGDWRQLLDMVTEPFIPGDWYDSQTGQWNNPLQASGLSEVFNRARDSLTPDQRERLSTAEQARLNASRDEAQGNANSQRERIIQGIMDRIAQQASNSIGGISLEESRRRAEEIYNSAPEMTRQEWRRTQESMDWNNFWNSQGQGTTRNAVTGLPAQDLIDDMINQMQQRAMDFTNMMIARRGTRER